MIEIGEEEKGNREKGLRGSFVGRELMAVLEIGHSAFDDNPWILRLVDYVAKALAHPRIRVIGVCFGHQIVGRAMGVKVARSDIGWETSVCGVELSKKGKEVFGQDGLVF